MVEISESCKVFFFKEADKKFEDLAVSSQGSKTSSNYNIGFIEKFFSQNCLRNRKLFLFEKGPLWAIGLRPRKTVRKI